MAKSKTFNFLNNEDYTVELISVKELIEKLSIEISELNENSRNFVSVSKFDNPKLFSNFLNNINTIENNPFYAIIPLEIRNTFNSFITGAIVSSIKTKDIVSIEMINATIQKLLDSNFDGIDAIEKCQDGSSIQVVNDGHIFSIVLIDVRPLTEKIFLENCHDDVSEFKSKIIIDCHSDIFEYIVENLKIDKKLNKEEQKIFFESNSFYQAFCTLSFKSIEDRKKCIGYLSRVIDKDTGNLEKAIVYH